MKNGKTASEMKGRETKLKEDRGAIVLQLQRAIQVNRNRENGKHREKLGNDGIRGVMRRGWL